MYDAHVKQVLEQLKPTDLLLDIGGWACPFNRANYVLDAEPYETRGYYKTVGLPASQGGDKEFFTKDTWIVRDICEHTPYPFADKYFDFVTCSHVLEDIRDPLWVCSEMIRIAKRGYIEVPSRLAESCRGWESNATAGLTHHRWLIDIDREKSNIQFLHKHHMIHADRRFSLPRSVFRKLTDSDKITWLFWDHTFTYSESSVHGLGNITSELEGFVKQHYQYPGWLLQYDRTRNWVASKWNRLIR